MESLGFVGLLYYRLKHKKSGKEVVGLRYKGTPAIIMNEFRFDPDFTLLEVRPAGPEDVVVCEFCREPVKLGEGFVGYYYSNGHEKKAVFCDARCLAYRQMGAEG